MRHFQCTLHDERQRPEPYETSSSRFSANAVRQRCVLCTATSLLLSCGLSRVGAGQATIQGRVLDSLGVASSSDAPRWRAPTVALVGSSLVAELDARGRFVISGVLPGEQRLVVVHPFLDSLDVAPPPVIVHVGRDGVARTTLGVPSPASIYRWLCGRPMAGDGAVAGRVYRSDGATPVRDAVVASEWSERVIGAAKSAAVQRRVSAMTRADGAFTLCGAPADVPADLSITAADGSVARLSVEFAAVPLEVRDVILALPGDPDGTVSGLVLDAQGHAASNVLVAVSGDSTGVRTDSLGRFRLEHVRPGTHRVTAHRIGQHPGQAAIQVRSAEVATVTLRIGGTVQLLAPQRILTRQSTGRDGFALRRHRGAGQFITGEEMEKFGFRTVSDALRRVNGLWGALEPNGGAWRFLMRSTIDGTNCMPRVYVGGFLWHDWGNPFEDLEVTFRTRDMVGIEVYRATEAPANYPPDIRTGCGVIVITTKLQ